ncbi:GNAT family N-acetyltransferase [Phreatobacter stygius]|uniref:GNAT family N-acetyltransferase n=1 Tax=Phreatobacter stygius TaxID=1940610 RepID=A0A4D7B6Z7_9HYPH|nr:GNAT family protein [Phreatobacter stygius]QCI68731.1 GNAT family N-acetyltransferase [Phreatobacter stygius]
MAGPAIDVSLRRAAPDDLDFIMAAERQPAFERQVGRWSAERHQAAMASADFAYLIGMGPGGLPAGFAILRDLNNASDNIGLQRIVSAAAGQGFGKPFLTAVIDWVFAETRCHRFLLEVFTDNPRARHVYRSLGFVEEGLLREAVKRADGARADQMLMSLLRREWRAP